MIAMLCLDDNNGMLFHNRRQSQDRVLRARMLELAGGEKLWMNAYSAAQFEAEAQEKLQVDERFLAHAGRGAYCLIENTDLLPYAGKIEELILFYWNRSYPADLRFAMDLSGWQLISRTEFAGYSHEKITEERYIRCKTEKLG